MSRPNKHPLHRSAVVASLACLGLALAVPAGAAGSFDGTYKGTQRVTRSNNSQACDSLTKDNMVLVIRDNHFNRGWYETVIGIDVTPDGTFHQTQMITVGRRQAVVQVNGKITGASFEGDIGTDACAAHLSLTKS
jgi:hypothetical protein